MTNMDSLPLEILDTIARAGGYRGLLCFRVFTDSLSVSRRVDFMIELGYSIEISNDCIVWRYCGYKHRISGPAVEYSYNMKYWNIDMRSLYPKGYDVVCSAIEGARHWYVNGKKHRVGKPASKYLNGSEEWWLNGLRHRLDEPASVMSHCFKQ